MEQKPDIKSSIAGITFKSPVIVSSSEITSSPWLVDRLKERNIGGIVTKTFAGKAQNRIRLRPYQFPLSCFGEGYRESGSLYSVASAHVEGLDQCFEQVAEMAGICRKYSMRLIGSFYDDPQDSASWAKHARTFEDAGADMMELNFSSPSAAKMFTRGADLSTGIIGEVKRRVSMPVGLKLSPTMEPLEQMLTAWEREGLDFITAHNAPGGIIIDTEREEPFGAPVIGGYVPGRVFLPYSLARVVRIRKASSVPVVGVGGIYGCSDALQYLLCGCPLIGVGSALYFRGPEVLDQICDGLLNWMERKGYRSLNDFLGKAFGLIEDSDGLKRREPHGYSVPPECPYIPFAIKDKCTHCGACEEACIYGAITIGGKERFPSFDEGKCWSCGFCAGICPSGAIELRDRNDFNRTVWDNQGTAWPFKHGGIERIA